MPVINWQLLVPLLREQHIPSVQSRTESVIVVLLSGSVYVLVEDDVRTYVHSPSGQPGRPGWACVRGIAADHLHLSFIAISTRVTWQLASVVPPCCAQAASLIKKLSVLPLKWHRAGTGSASTSAANYDSTTSQRRVAGSVEVQSLQAPTCLTVGETIILLHPPLPLGGAWDKKGVSSNDSLADC